MVQLHGAPERLVKEIERLVEKHKRAQVASDIDLSLSALEDVLAVIKAVALVRGYTLTSNEKLCLLSIHAASWPTPPDKVDQINQLGKLIAKTFAK